MDKRIRVTVDGRVQGVFFRARTREMAISLGVSGWVRNLPGGQVEAVFEGPEDLVDSAVSWVGHGPERAVVTSVKTFAEQPEGASGFEIRG